MTDQSFGSGYFGEWFTDAFGLPAYRYTCDQVHDPKAISPTSPIWRAPTDHSHQVGNDRLVAVASNYGYVQVRQDEGGPKFLNDYDPPRGHYAGGFGYLTDGEAWLSTFYPGHANAFERVFGIGYYRKTASGAGLTADQVIFAPFGDDPLLISQVTITNRRDTPAQLRWIEYWGCQAYQFSHRAQVLSVISRGKRTVPELRRQFAERFSHGYVITGVSDGLLSSATFRGYGLGPTVRWGLAQIMLATVARKFTGGALIPPVRQAALDDLRPPLTFLSALDAPADALSTDEAAFFGRGGAANPDGLNARLAMTGRGAGMFLERRVHLPPGAGQTLYFAYGYLTRLIDLDTWQALLAKYRADLPEQWERSSTAWKSDRIQLHIPDEPWVDRELTWHNYYLRSNLTYDSFFQEHILSQGHVYQYIIGFQGAARDPLQHALPFTFTQPQIVREIIRYTLKEVLPDGEIPYGVTGSGMRMAVPFRPSDQELWLLWLASEYVLATRDAAFLEEEIPTFPLYGPKAGRARVRSLLARCYRHLTRVTGTGRHGLLRMSNGDWNDGAVLEFVPKKEEERVRKTGESVLNAAFAAYALELYAQMLTYAGDRDQAEDARQAAEGQRRAVREQWSGKWFRRSWLGENLGWIGEDILWLEPQPWAVLGGATTRAQDALLLEAIDECARARSPIGARLTGAPLKESRLAPGTLTNGGVWPSINGTLVWALARLDGARAWDEWKKNMLAAHAEAYPDVWYGIWSGPDSYNSTLSQHPGQTFFDESVARGENSDTPLGSGANWIDFPVMNMHPNAWPLYDVTKLIGVEFTPLGVELQPSLPKPAYRFYSPLLGFEKSAEGYRGWYAPSRAGEWRIALELPESERERWTHLTVNGATQTPRRRADGALEWVGASAPGRPLLWSLT